MGLPNGADDQPERGRGAAGGSDAYTPARRWRVYARNDLRQISIQLLPPIEQHHTGPGDSGTDHFVTVPGERLPRRTDETQTARIVVAAVSMAVRTSDDSRDRMPHTRGFNLFIAQMDRELACLEIRTRSDSDVVTKDASCFCAIDKPAICRRHSRVWMWSGTQGTGKVILAVLCVDLGASDNKHRCRPFCQRFENSLRSDAMVSRVRRNDLRGSVVYTLNRIPVNNQRKRIVAHDLSQPNLGGISPTLPEPLLHFVLTNDLAFLRLKVWRQQCHSRTTVQVRHHQDGSDLLYGFALCAL